MTLHSGSTRMAHQLNRFSTFSDFEEVACDASRLNVETETVRLFRNWFGEELITIISTEGTSTVPAFEAEIRQQVHGEKLQRVQQMGFDFSTNHYSHDVRGW